MQTESLSTQGLKALLQKVIGNTVEEPIFTLPVIQDDTAVQDVVIESLPSTVEGRIIDEEVVEPAIEPAPVVVKPVKQPKSIAKKEEKEKIKLDQLTTKVSAQEEALEQAQLEIQKLKTNLQTTENSLTLKAQAVTLDNQEAKARLIRLIEDKKELEDKVTLLSGEKATLAARLQSFMQKHAKQEETELLLTDQIRELTAALEATTEELANIKSLEAKNRELTETLETKTKTVEHLEQQNHALQNHAESTQQELTVTKACLHEQSALFEEEQQKHRILAQEHVFAQKRSEEQENHLRLLEQHLARRVKECALVSKQLDDLMDRTSQLQSSLTASSQRCMTLEESLEAAKKIEHALRIEFDAHANSMQDTLNQKESELQDCIRILEQKETELAALRKLETRFHELEELTRRSMQILSTAEPPQVKTFFGFEA